MVTYDGYRKMDMAGSRSADRPGRPGRLMIGLTIALVAVAVNAQTFDGLHGPRVDEAAEYAEAGDLAGRLEAMDELLASLILTCAPSMGSADKVEIALARLLRDIDEPPEGSTEAEPRVIATSAERRSIEIAHQLSQVICFLLDERDSLYEALTTTRVSASD